MAALQGVLFLVLGVGLLAVDYRALTTGWLPCGPRGLSGRLKFQKGQQPFAFWLMFAVYGAGGAWLVVFAVRLLAGHVEPLPLR
jgi:hypothetical protein